MPFAIRVLLLWVAALAVTSTSNSDLWAHQFKDGFIERAVAIVVRPDQTIIEYSIGANEATRQRLIECWSGVNSAETDERSAEDTGGAIDARFVAAVGQAIARRLVVAADGKPLAIELVEVIPTPRHHVEATVVLRFSTPQPVAGKKIVTLTFEDRNFFLSTAGDKAEETEEADNGEPSPVPLGEPSPVPTPVPLGGAFRYAFKATGGVMLNRSTVAPLLVRAKRLEDADLSPDHLKEHMRFGGELILPVKIK